MGVGRRRIKHLEEAADGSLRSLWRGVNGVISDRKDTAVRGIAPTAVVGFAASHLRNAKLKCHETNAARRQAHLNQPRSHGVCPLQVFNRLVLPTEAQFDHAQIKKQSRLFQFQTALFCLAEFAQCRLDTAVTQIRIPRVRISPDLAQRANHALM
jgi:hypothetical protein